MLCAVCEEHHSKYTCPRCSLKTCSLVCVKRHKKESDCDGQRDKTAFVSIEDFTESNLLSDYRFLEDTNRKADVASRDPLQRHGTPKFLSRLVYQSRRRGIELKILPYPMTKRKQNRTIFEYRSKHIAWFTEWLFTEEETSYSFRFDENTTLKAALLHFIHSTSPNAAIRHKLRRYLAAITMSQTSTQTTNKAQSQSQSTPLATSHSDSQRICKMQHSETINQSMESYENNSKSSEESQIGIHPESKDKKSHYINHSFDRQLNSDVFKETEYTSQPNVKSLQTDMSSTKEENELEFAKACTESEEMKSLEDGEITDDSEDELMRKQSHANEIGDEYANEKNDDSENQKRFEDKNTTTKQDDEENAKTFDTRTLQKDFSEAKESQTSKRRSEEMAFLNVDEFSWDDVAVFLKAEQRPANDIRYYRLNLAENITDNLKGKLIIEYPTFHVALRKNWHLFEIQT